MAWQGVVAVGGATTRGRGFNNDNSDDGTLYNV